MSREKKRLDRIIPEGDLEQQKPNAPEQPFSGVIDAPNTIEALRILHFAKLPQLEQFHRYGSVIVPDLPDESSSLSAEDQQIIIDTRTQTLKDLERRVESTAKREKISPEILEQLKKEVDADLVESLKQSIVGEDQVGKKSFKTIMAETAKLVQSKIEALANANASLAEAFVADPIDIQLMDKLQREIDEINNELSDKREELARELHQRNVRQELPIQPIEEKELKEIIDQINQVKAMDPDQADAINAAMEKTAVTILEEKLSDLTQVLNARLAVDKIDLSHVERVVSTIDKIKQGLEEYGLEKSSEIMRKIDQDMAPYQALKSGFDKLVSFGASPDEIKEFSNRYNLADLNNAVRDKQQQLVAKMSVPLERINSDPIAKDAKNFFNDLIAEIKDSKTFVASSASEVFPSGIGDVPFKAELDYLVKQRDAKTIDQATYQASVEQLVGTLISSVEAYQVQREKSFSALLKQAQGHAKEVENAPFAYQYDADVQRDLAAPVKAAGVVGQKVDLAVLKDPETRKEAMPEILASMRAVERAAVDLKKADDNLQRNLTEGTLFTEIPVEMKSVNRGTPATGVSWTKDTASPEFQAEHPELFGTDKLGETKEKSSQGPANRLTAGEVEAIRQKSSAQFSPNEQRALGREDIAAARIKLSEPQIERIILHSEQMLAKTGSGQPQKIINELTALLKGDATRRLSPTAAQIDQQITEILGRVERNSGVKAGVAIDQQVAQQASKEASPVKAEVLPSTNPSRSEQRKATAPTARVGLVQAAVNWLAAGVAMLVNAVKGLFTQSEPPASPALKEDNVAVKSVGFPENVDIQEVSGDSLSPHAIPDDLLPPPAPVNDDTKAAVTPPPLPPKAAASTEEAPPPLPSNRSLEQATDVSIQVQKNEQLSSILVQLGEAGITPIETAWPMGGDERATILFRCKESQLPNVASILAKVEPPLMPDNIKKNENFKEKFQEAVTKLADSKASANSSR